MTTSAPAKRNRQKAEKAGRRAELLAAIYLTLRGFQILERRYKTRAGEIDLIAKRKDTLIFAEVKARPSVDLAVEAVTPRARRRIEQASRIFLSRQQRYAHYGVQFDIMAVTGLKITRLRDAWREGE